MISGPLGWAVLKVRGAFKFLWMSQPWNMPQGKRGGTGRVQTKWVTNASSLSFSLPTQPCSWHAFASLLKGNTFVWADLQADVLTKKGNTLGRNATKQSPTIEKEVSEKLNRWPWSLPTLWWGRLAAERTLRGKKELISSALSGRAV